MRHLRGRTPTRRPGAFEEDEIAPEISDGPDRPVVHPRRSLREQVTQALRSAMVTGELSPGVVYSAPALAAEFGVSATPVREAMLDLVREGLVETVRNKGFRIIGVTDHDLQDFNEIRALIEIPATVQVARCAKREQLEPLRPVAREIVEAAKAGDLAGYTEADRRFHLGLLELTGNRHLVGVVRELRKRARLFGLTSLVASGRLLASAKEHEQLLNLMLTQDVDGVRKLMGNHFGHLRSSWAVPPEG